MKTFKCPGRNRIQSDQYMKWYLLNGKSSMLYTCCEECYNKYIKGTDQEKNYELNDNLNNCNCDFLLYKTDCDFSDCSLINKKIRLSIIDESGERFKNDNTTFFVTSNSKLFAIIENLDQQLHSYIGITEFSINNNKLNSKNLLKEDFTKYMLEIELLPLNQKKNIIFDEINVHFKLCTYNELDTFNIFELLQLPDGTFIDPGGKPWLKLNSTTSKFKAFLDVSLYECVTNNESEFNFTIKFTDNIENQLNEIVDNIININI